MIFRAVLPVLALTLALGLAPRVGAATLTHRWTLDEGSGSTAADSGALAGTLQNAPAWSTDVPSQIGGGRSLSFDAASSQYVSLASTIVLDDVADFSVSLWYKGTDSSSATYGHTLVGWDGDIYANLGLKGGKVTYFHFDDDWQENVTSATSVSDGAWHHIALVNHANRTADLYVDGVREVTAASSVIDFNRPYAEFNINGFMRGYGGPAYTDGSIDDVRIYGDALTQADVTALAGSAVPEPAGLALAGLAAAALAARRARRRS